MSISLPPLNYAHRVNPDRAKHDKIEMELGAWCLDGSAEDMSGLRQFMSSPYLEDRGIQDIGEAYAVLFKRHQDPDITPTMNFGRMAFRKEKVSIGGREYAPPLVAGYWVFRPQGDYRVTHLDVSFNPTLFARLQRFGARPSQHGHYRWRPSYNAHDVPRLSEGEFSYDGKSNWLPQGPIMQASATLWPEILTASCEGLANWFEAILLRQCRERTASLQVIRAQSLNLKTCETYFEFTAADPVAEVMCIKPLLEAYSAGDASTRTYQQLNAETGVDGHSHSVRIQCGPGRELKVYAKTNQRVRFEVKHRMVGDNPHVIRATQRVRGRAAPRQPLDEPASGHTAGSYAAFPQFIARLSEDAASLLNRVFAFIQPRLTVTPSMTTPFFFMQRVIEVVGEPSRAASLLNLLLHDNMLQRRVLPPEFASSLDALLAEGILQTAQDGRTTRPYPYEIAPAFREALGWLRQSARPVVFPAVPVRTRSSTSP